MMSLDRRQVLQPVFNEQQLRDGDGAAQQSLIAAVLDGAACLRMLDVGGVP